MFRSVRLLFLSLLLTLPILGHASDTGFTRFDKHTVYHSVFSSTAIKPEIAEVYGITRAPNQMLVNVALVSNDRQLGGEPARVSGTVTNLMQQQRRLSFEAIDEGDVVYYIAPLRITDRDTLHFNLQVETEDGASSYEVKFTKQVYVNN